MHDKFFDFVNFDPDSSIGRVEVRDGGVGQARAVVQREAHGPHMECKYVWVWKNASLLCLSGMSLKSVMHEQEKGLVLPVMQKRSLSYEKRNTQKRQNLSCWAVYCSAPTIRRFASQVYSRPRHICNPYHTFYGNYPNVDELWPVLKQVHHDHASGQLAVQHFVREPTFGVTFNEAKPVQRMQHTFTEEPKTAAQEAAAHAASAQAKAATQQAAAAQAQKLKEQRYRNNRSVMCIIRYQVIILSCMHCFVCS